jgi:hypothetical protein
MARTASLLGSMKALTLGALLTAVVAGTNLACVSGRERRQPLRQGPAPRLDQLLPAMTVAGKGFQVQPSGASAIAVLGANFGPASRVYLNGKPAVTTYGSSTGLTALVPAEFYRQPGTIEVTVQNGDGQVSNSLLFQVLPATGPPPRISRLHPSSCVVGQGFNLQPSGESAIVVEGTNFLPGAIICFDRTELASTFGSPGVVTGIVPASLLEEPRSFQVRVRNPDGKVSNSITFSVQRHKP